MVEISPVDENEKDIFSIASLVGPELLKKVNTPAVSTDKEAFLISGSSSSGKGKKGNKKNQQSTSSTNPALIGLYFSANWCPPCKRFTPLLIEFYNTAKKLSSTNEFEIIYVSSDRSNEEFEEYYGKMPWLAIPPGTDDSGTIKTKLSETLGVTGIPALAILDGTTGEFICGGTARDDVIRVTGKVAAVAEQDDAGGNKGETEVKESHISSSINNQDQVKVVLEKWKSMERKSILEAPRLMDTGSGAQSFLGKVLGFFAKNPMFIFGFMYLYQYVKKQIMAKATLDGDGSDNGGDMKPPSIVDNDDNEF